MRNLPPPAARGARQDDLFARTPAPSTLIKIMVQAKARCKHHCAIKSSSAMTAPQCSSVLGSRARQRTPGGAQQPHLSGVKVGHAGSKLLDESHALLVCQ